MSDTYPFCYMATGIDALEALMYAFSAEDFNPDESMPDPHMATYFVEVYPETISVRFPGGFNSLYSRALESDMDEFSEDDYDDDVAESDDTDTSDSEFLWDVSGSVVHVTGNEHVIVNVYMGGSDE